MDHRVILMIGFAICFTSMRSRAEEPCALIVTDDDIPSGSATAGAMYVSEAELGKKLLTSDVVSAVKGFRAAGLTCVDVLDGHEKAIDKPTLRALHVPVFVPSQSDWKWPFLGPMKKKYKVAALVGFHSNAGVKGFRSHTINDYVKGLSVNHHSAGEVTHLIVGLAAFGVPVGIITGDMNAVQEGISGQPGAKGVSVRWLKPDGIPSFMTQEEAAKKIFDEAKAVARKSFELQKPNLPVDVSMEFYSRDAVHDLASSMESAFAKMTKETSLNVAPANCFGEQRLIKWTGHEVSWASPNALSAYLTIAFASDYFRGPDNWDLVDRGYDAFVKEHFDESVQMYRRALEKNKYDTATRCRLAASLRGQNKIADSREYLSLAMDRIDEIDDVMKGFCYLELAFVEEKLGHKEAAKKAAQQVLGFPDRGTRHDEARKILNR